MGYISNAELATRKSGEEIDKGARRKEFKEGFAV